MMFQRIRSDLSPDAVKVFEQVLKLNMEQRHMDLPRVTTPLYNFVTETIR